MPASPQHIKDARERLDKTADVYWGLHSSLPAREGGPHDPEAILERVMADYALVGKTPIDVIKQRAAQRVKENNATQG